MKEADRIFEVSAEWVHIRFRESVSFTEVYGFSGSQGIVNLEGVRFVPQGPHPTTLLVFMHPATSTQFLPMPRALAQRGHHVLCAGNRYACNDTPLIMEKVAVDLGAYLRHAREAWGYQKIVLCGWSGGGPLALFYQSQAQRPTVTATPAGEAYDLTAAGLLPADAVIFQAANMSRATLLAEWLDPSVTDEDDPDRRIVEFDIYDPRNPNQPPHSTDYIAQYRAAQLGRMRRRTAWVKETLAQLKKAGGKEMERGFVNHSHDGGSAIHGRRGRPQRPQTALLPSWRSGNQQFRPSWSRQILDPALMVVAMVDR
jgi:pimeloyl-ACP methyl ester carboxylesterase